VKIFFDTSILVAAFWREHPKHTESIEVFRHAKPQQAFCGVHSLAEFYSTMTALPVRNPIDPQQTLLFIEEIRRRCTLVSLTEAEYAATIEAAASKGFTSGKIYDALLLQCAHKIKAEVIYTWNLKHFRAIDPSQADRIHPP
jgi:predicted nucleic acid-binding protein